MKAIRWPMLGLLVLFSGCGGGDGVHRVPIRGTLTSQGAKAIDEATLLFIPDDGTPGDGAIGRTNESGAFTVISSRAADAGIPPGKYRVRVSRLVDGKTRQPIPSGVPEADSSGAVESIPLPYSSANSPLMAEIKEGGDCLLDIPAQLK